MAASRRPRLLVLASTYPRWSGDPEPGFVHELCRRLATRFEVTALVPDAPGADPSGPLDGVRVVRYRYAPRRWQTLVQQGGIVANLRRSPWKWLLVPGFILGQYLAARRLLRHDAFDLVHAHWLIPQGLVARALGGVPYVVTSHGGDLFGLRGRTLSAIKRFVARWSVGMTVVSSAMRAEAARLGLSPPRLEVLPMGVDLRERFVPDPDVVRGTDRLLFVGRLVAKKGVRHLLDALPAIRARRPGVVLDVVGYGPEQDTLHAQAQRLGLVPCVNFLGALEQKDLPRLYRGASLLVAPFVRDAAGDQEGLPVVLMEAIGCGCPVVAGAVDGIEDLLGPASPGITVPADDTAALAAAVLRELDDPAGAAVRAARLRAAVADRLDWSRVAAVYAEFLQSCATPR